LKKIYTILNIPQDRLVLEASFCSTLCKEEREYLEKNYELLNKKDSNLKINSLNSLFKTNQVEKDIYSKYPLEFLERYPLLGSDNFFRRLPFFQKYIDLYLK